MLLWREKRKKNSINLVLQKHKNECEVLSHHSSHFPSFYYYWCECDIFRFGVKIRIQVVAPYIVLMCECAHILIPINFQKLLTLHANSQKFNN